MSFDYMGIKRIKNAMELSLTPECATFDPSVLVWWLDATQEMYRRGNTRAVFDGPTQAFLDKNRKAAEDSFAALCTPGSLLLKATITAYETHLSRDIDKNLLLIAAATEHAKAIATLPVAEKTIRYTIKKHRDSNAQRVLTVRSDVLNDFGFEGGCLALHALTKAVGRDLDKKVSVWNIHDLFAGRSGTRVAPEYEDQVFFLHTYLVEYLGNNLPLAEVKENLGVIKTLHDYFETLEIPG